MGGRGTKRKFAHDDESSSSTISNNIGMGAVLAHLRNPDAPALEPQLNSSAPEPGASGALSPGWEQVGGKRHKKPKIPPKDSSNYPSITHAASARLNSRAKISDLQSLVLYLLADGTAPQWISVRHHQSFRKVVVLMVPGLERDMFDGQMLREDPAEAPSNGHKRDPRSPDAYYPIKLAPDQLPASLMPLADMFAHLWPITTPGDDRYSKMFSPLAAMLTAPLPKSKEDKKAKGAKPPREGKDWQNKRTPITGFIATADELRENEFLLHPALLSTETQVEDEQRRRQAMEELSFDGWVDSRIEKLEDGDVPDAEVEKGSMTAGRVVLAMDCEMCRTEGGALEITRVSLVGWDGDVVLDDLVKPRTPIIDYLTPYSGMTKEMLDPVETELSDVQAQLLGILQPNTVLVGHSLNADLTALKMTHPFLIDTSIIYPHPRGPPLKSSLKWLAQKYLLREIQKGHGSSGHDSIEDAKACLDLLKQKCEKGPLWGTSEASSESIFKRLSRSSRPGTQGPFGAEGRVGAVVDWGNLERGAGAQAPVRIRCESDDEVVRGVADAVNGDGEGKIVARGGADFVWARMRELEALRGWWNDNRVVKDAEPSAAAVTTGDVHQNGVPGELDVGALNEAVGATVARIRKVYDSLPPCSALIVYSGSGDPREMSRLQAVQQQFRREYQTKKWDELSVKWTDVEEQALKQAVGEARAGIGLIAVK